ncbi:MAG: hypothetical protein Q9192_005604 [Flavoplaca navasiana]
MDTRITIEPVRNNSDLKETKILFLAYAESLGIDLAFQDFQTELKNLPGVYAPPPGELLIARDADGSPLGCVALRPMQQDGCCEMKRLYIYHESEDLLAAADRQYFESLENASHEHRRLLKQHASDLLNRGTMAATEEDRDRLFLTAAAYLQRARDLVPWCLAVEILAFDVENWDGCEDDEMLIKRSAVSRALQVYDEECLW